jgi:fatty acid synthase subunit alpha
VLISISTSHNEWISAEILRESFIHSQKLQDTIDTTIQLGNDSEATVELSARFLTFVAKNVASDPNSFRPWINLLYNTFNHFTKSYLVSQDVHTFSSALGPHVRRTVISSYFKTLATLESSGVTAIPRQPPLALFNAARDGDALIYAVFGGQGTNGAIVTNSGACKTSTLHTSHPPFRLSPTNSLPPSSVHPPSPMTTALTFRPGCLGLHLALPFPT